MANIVVLYHRIDPAPFRGTVREHLYSFRKYSTHNVRYVNVGARGLPSHLYDEPVDLIIFHTIFFGPRWGGKMKSFLDNLQPSLSRLGGVRVMLPQDEFHRSRELVDFVRSFGITHIFSVAPESEWPKIYEGVDRAKVAIHKVLTGYLDNDTVAHIERLAGTVPERTIDVGYRAWGARPWVGRHGMLKTRIADVFNERGPRGGLRCDVSTRAEDTLYGDDWLRFLMRCRYTIGVEGGASLLDPDGSILGCVEQYLRAHPGASFDEVEARCFPGQDGRLHLFALSPRHLECCATRTGQVLIEGRYDDVLVPDRHYIPLRADFSNLDAVVEAMTDETLRRQMVTASYEDIVASGRYSYRSFVELVIEQSLGAAAPARAKNFWWRLDAVADSLVNRRVTWVAALRRIARRLVPSRLRPLLRNLVTRRSAA